MKKIDLYKFAELKNPYREVMAGVFHDQEAGMAVASNCHILVASRDAYDPERAGQVVRQDGTVPVYGPDRKDKEGQPLPFPKWRDVVNSATKNNINTLPMDQLREAVRRADNFRKNRPDKWPDGMKISRDRDNRIYIAIKADGVDSLGKTGTFTIVTEYKDAKTILGFPQDGASVTFCDGRRAILYKNDGVGLIAAVMPFCLDDKIVARALENGIDDMNRGYIDTEDGGRFYPYDFSVVISAVGDSDEARKMFREPEKKAPSHFVPCVEQTGYDRLGGAVYGVRKRLDETFRGVPGTETFFYAIDKKQSNFPIFKKDGAYYIRVATNPSDGNWERIAKQTERMGWDAMPYDQIAASQGWTAENNKTVAVWKALSESATK